jgi:hypothetical protein
MKNINNTNILELQTLLQMDKTISRLNSLILAIGRTKIPGEFDQFSNTILLEEKRKRLIKFYNYLCEFILNIAHMEYYTLWEIKSEIQNLFYNFQKSGKPYHECIKTGISLSNTIRHDFEKVFDEEFNMNPAVKMFIKTLNNQ